MDGDGRPDFTAVAALKTHVSLREALELEAVACAAGDRRHDFQAFYPKWKEAEAKRAKQGADVSNVGKLDPARVLEDLEMTRQAIAEHEALLAEHRLAIIEGRPSTLRDEDVDAIYATIENMRGNLPAMEAAYEKLVADTHREGGVGPSPLEDLRHVGPVQSGTLRPRKGGG